MTDERPTLSICLTCRDGREEAYGARGGQRLAWHFATKLDKHVPLPVQIRGGRCMSQCKSPCVVALSAPDAFSYLFGDLDPDNPTHVAALFDLAESYAASEEGFVERTARPEALRAIILGCLPPLNSRSVLVSELGLPQE